MLYILKWPVLHETMLLVSVIVKVALNWYKSHVSQVPVAARMWGRAVLLVLAVSGVCGAGGGGKNNSKHQEPAYDKDQLKVGRAINIFTRLGYLSISMRVIPRNDSDHSWLFREPTVDVFNNIDHLATHTRRNISKKPPLDGDFHMEFCDNARQLLQAYFRDFAIDRLEKPWRAFTGSWNQEMIARHMGINSSFVHGNHCYVLVRLSRFRESVKLEQLPKNVQLLDAVAKEIANLEVGNVSSVLQFIKQFGSHYITSYVTGNSLYQAST